MDVGNTELSWLGHAGFHLEAGGKHVYIDPYEIGRTRPDADYIFITHDHYDHLSIEDLDNILTPDTVIVAPKSCQDKLDGLPAQLRLVERGQSLELDDLSVEAVASYNTDKQYHPESEGWVGYILDIDGTRIYHAGDTDVIDEMSGVEADVALLPVSGTYVMTAKEAAKAVEKIDVKQAVPMHYGAIIGDASDAEKFKELSSVPVTILTKS